MIDWADKTVAKMLPCPFCGSENIEISTEEIHHINSSWDRFTVKCRDGGCYAEISYPSQDGAIKKWNTRTSPKGESE